MRARLSTSKKSLTLSKIQNGAVTMDANAISIGCGSTTATTGCGGTFRSNAGTRPQSYFSVLAFFASLS
jgi:positive regulator of sigma E activity